MNVSREARRQGEYNDMISEQKPQTWSATEPPYAYTPLCPDPRRRVLPDSHCSCNGDRVYKNKA